MRFIPNDAQTQREMLDAIGAADIAALFACVPQQARLGRPLAIPPGLAEEEQLRRFASWGAQNTGAGMLSFLGGGAYAHFTPLVVDTLLQRSEFFTSYTPYQPEASQGALQAMFEFQTFITLLTGMEVANASLYDGASAAAEAVLMAWRLNKGGRVLLAESLHPWYRDTVRTYTSNLGLQLQTVPLQPRSGRLELAALEAALAAGKTSCVVVQQPGFFGVIEDLQALARLAHQADALLVVVINEAYSLALLQTPGAQGADIVAGEAQSFGAGLQFGGPYLGFLATRELHKRQLPGRIAGRAVDAAGRAGFVLAMSTREQHIRRARATSNICSNQNLVMLGALIHLTLMGRAGLLHTARHNLCAFQHFLHQLQHKAPGYRPVFSGAVFNEATLECPRPAEEVLEACIAQGIVAGVPLGRWDRARKNQLLISVTETKTAAHIERLAAALAAV